MTRSSLELVQGHVIMLQVESVKLLLIPQLLMYSS